jgi:hypothetical protein
MAASRRSLAYARVQLAYELRDARGQPWVGQFETKICAKPFTDFCLRFHSRTTKTGCLNVLLQKQVKLEKRKPPMIAVLKRSTCPVRGSWSQLLLAGMIAMLSVTACAHASNLVVDGGFEAAGGGNVYFGGQSIDGGSWVVGPGSDIYIDNTTLLNPDPFVYDGSNSVNLTAENPYAPNSLSQVLSTVIGQRYIVNFWADSDTPNTFSLLENGLAVMGAPTAITQAGFPGPITNSLSFVDYSGLFVANSSSTVLDFTATADPAIGSSSSGSVMIDDVTVQATPEPVSVVLLLTGIMGVGLLIGRKRLALGAIPLIALSAVGVGTDASAQTVFTPGNLVVSRSLYSATPGSVVVGQTLPPGCVANKTNKVTCGTAATDGTFPTVFNNDTPDPSFGVTSPIYLDEMTPSGTVLNSIQVPNSSTTTGDQLVTSFSSKSEEALHLSTDGTYLAFIGYVAPLNTIDVSNANTPLVIDPTNPVPGAYYRAVATVNAQGQFAFTETNAYSGNNGRAAIYVNTGGNNFFYTAGNAGNGGNPEPQQVVAGAGVQIIQSVNASEASQTPGLPTPVASFSVSQLAGVPAATDKVGKDDNFRGMTLYNNVLYLTKGSGSNGVNTVYFVDTTGVACPSTSATPGIGLPVSGAPLPTASLASTYNSTTGLANNMCILAGFPTEVNKLTNPVAFPFGLWFANATTLYVADEGDGINTYNSTSNTYTDAASSANPGGLQKWIFNPTSQTWNLAYTMMTGLNLGVPYTVSGFPTGLNNGTDGTGLPWAPATDGLRNIIGTVEGNRFQGFHAVIWATSSTVSGNGDQGADPNKLYLITDMLTNTSPAVAAEETFTDLRNAVSGEVLRGVSFTPGTTVTSF